MWQLWILALFRPAAFQGVEHDPNKGFKGSLQEFQNGVTQNKTVLENGTDTPWRSTWLASTTIPLLTVQSSMDYKARKLTAPTITVHAKNGTCQALLSCAVPEEEAGNLSFTWFQVNGSVVLSTAQTLNIAQKPPQGAPDYICIVRSQAGESSSVVSLEKHCQGVPPDPPIARKYLSASFYAKYIAPPFIVLVILLVLFLMYRRKRGREIHSSMESINESSESDNEVGPSVEQTAEVTFLPEGIKPLSQDNTSTAETAIGNQEKASDTPKELPTQA